jgi:hypothetical protein
MSSSLSLNNPRTGAEAPARREGYAKAIRLVRPPKSELHCTRRQDRVDVAEASRNVPKRSRGKTYHFLRTQQPSIGRALIRSESMKTPSSWVIGFLLLVYRSHAAHQYHDRIICKGIGLPSPDDPLRFRQENAVESYAAARW